MLVHDYMTASVTTIGPDTRLPDALGIMRTQGIHHLPVVEDAQLIGIVSEKDLLYALPSADKPVSWVEAAAQAAIIPVREIMHRDVITICATCPIEMAAAAMADHDISALPVVDPPDSRRLVGIITKTDIFTLFVEMLGAHRSSVRASLEIDNRKGALASLFNRVVEAGGLVVSISTFPATSPARIRIILKVTEITQEAVHNLLKPEETIIDLREIRGTN
jgi:acetoin utilization protein AcuB